MSRCRWLEIPVRMGVQRTFHSFLFPVLPGRACLPRDRRSLMASSHPVLHVLLQQGAWSRRQTAWKHKRIRHSAGQSSCPARYPAISVLSVCRNPVSCVIITCGTTEFISVSVNANIFAAILCLTRQSRPSLRPDLSDDQHTQASAAILVGKSGFWGIFAIIFSRAASDGKIMRRLHQQSSSGSVEVRHGMKRFWRRFRCIRKGSMKGAAC